jgi:ribosomal protein S18 acetylase RimI-like enzyme
MTTPTFDLETLTKQFEQEFIIRPAVMDDAQKAADLYNASNHYFGSDGNDTAELIRSEWGEVDYDLGASSLAFFTKDEQQMVAFQEVIDYSTVPVRPRFWGHVHPDYLGRGIGTYLLNWAENLAQRVFDRVPADARVVFTLGRNTNNPLNHDLFVAHGYLPTGQAWQKMLIELTEDMPQDPPAPDGLRWVTMVEFNDTRKAYAAHRDAFHDHRGFIAEDFEVMYKRWSGYMLDEKVYDPTLWFMLMDGDTIAGYSYNMLENDTHPDEGYVGQLGVLPAYRRRGVGNAVLLKAFHELWKRGKRKVSLFVDGSSLTGANRLYTGAGMHVKESYASYEKEMRAGVEYSKQD